MNEPIAKIKYPLACGCAGPLYISMCATHQAEDIHKARQRMGIELKDPPHCPTCKCEKT